ncbi:MAG: SRPBCC family protein [Cyclobacteriaceae bacterium]
MKRSKAKVALVSFSAVSLIILAVAFTSPGFETHINSRTINAPEHVVWAVISDVGNYHRYATGLSGSTIISGEGEGLIRSCSDESGSWKETCTSWNEGRSYSFDVDVGSGYPYPFKKFAGTWSLSKLDSDVTDLTELAIEFEYQFPYRWMSWFYSDATHQFINEGNRTLLDNWESAINKNLVGLGTGRP